MIKETIAGFDFYRSNAPESDLNSVPQFGMYKSCLIVTLGQDMTSEIITKLKGPPETPTWLKATLGELKVDRPTVVWQVNVDAVWETIDSLIQNPAVRGALDVAGVRDLKRIAAVAGLDAVSSVDKMVIETKGQPHGLLALLPDTPLTARDLKGIPVNPFQAHVIRFDLDDTVERILKIADQFGPMPRQQFEAISDQIEPFLGFSIRDDFLKAFGDVWTIYAPAVESNGDAVAELSLCWRFRCETRKSWPRFRRRWLDEFKR